MEHDYRDEGLPTHDAAAAFRRRDVRLASGGLLVVAVLVAFFAVRGLFDPVRLEGYRLTTPCTYDATRGGVEATVEIDVHADAVEDGYAHVNVVNGDDHVLVSQSDQFHAAGSGKERHVLDFFIPLKSEDWTDDAHCEVSVDL